MPKYQLSQTLITDGDPVRVLALTDSLLISGSEAGLVSAIARTKSSSKSNCSSTDIIIQPGGEGTRHSHHITSLIRIPWGHNSYITGCKDTFIRIFDENHHLVRILKGHDNSVTSLSWLQVPKLMHPLLISGSWDGTAKVWSVESGQCLATLPGHENTVSVLGLPPVDNIARIATGSAGVARGSNIVDHKIRLWDITYDDILHAVSVHLKTTVDNDHNGPIRGLAYDSLSQMLLSCSNDGSVKVRDITTGEAVTTLFFPPETFHSQQPPMLLSVASNADGKIMSCSEDGNAVIWDVSAMSNEDSVQVIPHPSCIWNIITFKNGDFATACHDGCIRIFSENSEKSASDIEQVAFRDAVEKSRSKQSTGPSAEEIAVLPKWERCATVLGKSDGQVQLFQKNGIAIAAQWSAASVTWIEVGEVTGRNKNAGSIEGIEYDHVFPIEVDVPGGGIQNLQIGYNNGQNPFTVAQNFIDQHLLDQGYLSQIADYIRSRVGEGAGLSLGERNTTDSSTATPLGISTTQVSHGEGLKYLPMIGYKYFESGSDEVTLSKIRNKIYEFNSTLNSNLSPKEISSDLDHLCEIISATNRYHVTTISDSELAVILKMIKYWSVSQIYPAIDLARLAALHPDACKSSRYSFWNEVIGLVLNKCEESQKNQSGIAVPLLALRLFANIFRGGSGSQSAAMSNLKG